MTFVKFSMGRSGGYGHTYVISWFFKDFLGFFRFFTMDHMVMGERGTMNLRKGVLEKVKMVEFMLCTDSNGSIRWVRTYMRNFMVFQGFYDGFVINDGYIRTNVLSLCPLSFVSFNYVLSLYIYLFFKYININLLRTEDKRTENKEFVWRIVLYDSFNPLKRVCVV